METAQVKIEKAAYGGYGLGFINGKVCFVQFAMPGDIVKIEIYKEKKDLLFGSITEIIEKSKKRTEPVCPNFGICGGCDYLNLCYEDELETKKGILLEAMTRTRCPSLPRTANT